MKAPIVLLGCLALLPHWAAALRVLPPQNVIMGGPNYAQRVPQQQAAGSSLFRWSPLQQQQQQQRQQQQRTSRGGIYRATVEDRIEVATKGADGVSRMGGVVGFDTEMAPEDTTEWPYDWRKHWYAVGFDRDIVEGPKPYAVSIFDEPMVLYRDSSGALQCVGDFCPHRAAKLSEGQVTEEGNIECLYHGWQFEGSQGTCVKIPQLQEGGVPPRAANLRVYPLAVKEGVVYVWMGNDPWGEGAKEILPVPGTAHDLDTNKPTMTYEFVCDLPFDWSYLAENLLDPAHVQISHHNSEGGGKKENAGPIDFEVPREGPEAPGPTGFTSFVEMKSFSATKKKSKTRYRLEAPGVIRISSVGEKGAPVFGAALHCIPMGKGRSRFLYKTYLMNFPAMVGIMFALKPKFLRHLNSCKILEQDMKLICAQEDYVARTGETLAKSFIPLKSSDSMVVELRKWLDQVGHGMPFFQGWEKSKQPADLSNYEDTRRSSHRSQESRYHSHVLLSSETRRALANVKRVKKGGLVLAALLMSASVLLSSVGAARAVAAATAAAAAAGGSGGLAAVVGPRAGVAAVATACGAIFSLGLGVAAGTLEKCFFKNFERHPALG